MSRFKGLTYLTDDQYNTLITDGTLTVSGVTINFDPDMLYITPQEESAGVSQEDFDNLKNNVTQIVTADGKLSFRAGGANVTDAYASIAIGNKATVNTGSSIAIGNDAIIMPFASLSIAMGYNATAVDKKTIQLGEGSNTTPNTLQIFGDNIYNHDTHTLTVQNIELNGENLNDKLANAGGSSETEQITVTQEMVVDDVLTLEPNKYYIIPSGITFASFHIDDFTKEYTFEFTGRTSVYFYPRWKWANGVLPTLDANKTYQISVVNDLAVYGEFY